MQDYKQTNQQCLSAIVYAAKFCSMEENRNTIKPSLVTPNILIMAAGPDEFGSNSL